LRPVSKEFRACWQLLSGPDGAQLHLRLDQRHGRLCVSGVYPRDGGAIFPWHDKDRPNAIRISAQREPRTIAKDIERRYLPAYLSAYRKGLEMFTKARADEKANRDLAAKLARLSGVDLHASGHGFTCHGEDYGWCDVQVDHPDRVQVKIRGLNAPKAEALLTFLLSQPSHPSPLTAVAPA
jgi:hypothetical protein